jgi:hypothetical protein
MSGGMPTGPKARLAGRKSKNLQLAGDVNDEAFVRTFREWRAKSDQRVLQKPNPFALAAGRGISKIAQRGKNPKGPR